MRALSLRGPRDAGMLEIAEPSPGRGEVVVRVLACGVCGSDQNAWRGVPGLAYPLAPGAPGHEVCGEVFAVGEGVATLRPGDRVTGLMANGYAALGLARADDLVTVPRRFADRYLLGEPLACAMNVVRRGGLQGASRFAVVGFGYLAALVVGLLGDQAQRWVAISRREDSRALARQLGAEATYDFANVPAELWDSFDVVVEAAGVQQALDYATWLTAYGGRLAIAGYHADGPRTVNLQAWNWKGIDVINAHERQPSVYLAALRVALERLAESGFDPTRLTTHAFPLERAAEAFLTGEDRPAGFFKAVVCP